MLNNLKLTNIQSHKGTQFDFHPKVNVICGASDVGKSTVIRALKWNAINKPPGDRLRRHKTKKTTAVLDGVTKGKTASKHWYEYGGRTFKALRTDVPHEVSDALRLSEINFQEQHDAYFLIGDSPGQVARTLNEVADLQVIDLSLKAIKQKVREARADKKHLEGERAETVGEIDDLDWVIEADRDYKKIEALKAEAAAIDTSALEAAIEMVSLRTDEFDRIPSSVKDLEALSQAIKDLEFSPVLGETIQKVEDNQVSIPEPSEDLVQLAWIATDIALEIDSLELSVLKACNCKATVKAFPEEIAAVEPTLEELVGITEGISTVEEATMELYIAEDCAQEAEEVLLREDLEVKRKMKELGACPLCGSGL